MDYTSLLTEGKFTADTFIQHHRAVQPLTAISRLAKSPFGHQRACIDHRCASEKQPVKADDLSVACFKFQ